MKHKWGPGTAEGAGKDVLEMTYIYIHIHTHIYSNVCFFWGWSIIMLFFIFDKGCYLNYLFIET